MLILAEGPSSGFEVDIVSKKLSASLEVVTAILASAERIWSRTLDWASTNRIEFALVVVFLMYYVFQRRKTKTDMAAMKTKYDLERDRIRAQEPPLPLPPPEPRE